MLDFLPSGPLVNWIGLLAILPSLLFLKPQQDSGEKVISQQLSLAVCLALSLVRPISLSHSQVLLITLPEGVCVPFHLVCLYY